MSLFAPDGILLESICFKVTTSLTQGATGDQFYAEDQFESYRALGKSITKEAFDKIAGLKNEDEDKLELPTLRKILDL